MCGAIVQEVSHPESARLADVPDWLGFDLFATKPDGEVRSIEVKGRTDEEAAHMEANECHLCERYSLYAVFNCATLTVRLVRVRDPFDKLLASGCGVSTYNISAASLLEAAEQT